MNDAEFKGILEMRDCVIAQLAETINKQKARVTDLEKLIDAAAATLHGEDSDLMFEFTTKKIDITEYRRKVISRAWEMLVKEEEQQFIDELIKEEQK